MKNFENSKNYFIHNSNKKNISTKMSSFKDMEASISSQVRFYFGVTVVPLSIVSNIVSIYLFSQKSLNKNTKNGYLNAFLCLFNVFALFNFFLFSQILPYVGINTTSSSYFSCTFFNIYRRWGLQSPSVQQVFITLLFFLNLKYPTPNTPSERNKDGT